MLTDRDSIANYAENGALHYALHIIQHTNFKKVFAFGCSGVSPERLIIRPIYVTQTGYKILPRVNDFVQFAEENIERYYSEQVLGNKPVERVELENILSRAKVLHEDLKNYGQLRDSEKPLVVSSILLALMEKDFSVESLNGDDVRKDGQKIFDAMSQHLERVRVEPEEKKKIVLDRFSFVANRPVLSEFDKRLGKSPLRYFTEYIHSQILTAICNNTPEDVLGRFYGEFMSYSGGDGQTLGIILTPKHITELFVELSQVKPTDKVFDPCCGTAGFLIAALHSMLEQAKDDEEKKKIKKNNLYGIELRDDMFSIATTNMILRGDGKSNLICDDFLKQDEEVLKGMGYTVGLMNPPYSQRKKKVTAHLTELKFIIHLLDSLNDGGRCVVIVPQSTMVGKYKDDKEDKRYIYEHHTLEGVITLNPNTFYRVGVEPVIAVFTAHQPHPNDKLVKFVDFQDDGYEVAKHIGLMPSDRVAERKKELFDCWFQGKAAPESFIIRRTIEPDDEWLHSFYYYNDETPLEEDFKNTMVDYLTFEFDMRMHGREYLFDEEGTRRKNKFISKPEGGDRWKEFVMDDIFIIKSGVRLTKADMVLGKRPFIGATDSNNGITEWVGNENASLDKNVLGINYNGSVGETFYHPYECLFSDDVKRLHLRHISDSKYVMLFLKVSILKQKEKFSYGYKFNEGRMATRKILLPITLEGFPDWQYMEDYMRYVEQKLLTPVMGDFNKRLG